ncbi:MAG: DUF2157 domain-containing protein [Lautropia sp.]
MTTPVGGPAGAGAGVRAGNAAGVRPSKEPAITASDVLALVAAGRIAAGDAHRALQLAGCTPTADGWHRALSRLFAVLALALIVSGVVCLVAWNWAALGRWGRFGLAQAVLLALLAGAVCAGAGRPLGHWLLIAAIALIGPLLALFGQTYQTGADLHGLFAAWALLALPWVGASRAPAAWLLWLAIAEAALGLAVFTFGVWFEPWLRLARVGLPGWLLIAGCNAVALLAWELAGDLGLRLREFAGRSGPRVLAAVLVGVLAAMTVQALLPGGPRIDGAPPALAVVLAAGYYVYRHRQVDLAMLALGWLASTAVALALLARVLGQAEISPWFGLLLGAAVLVAASAFGRNWLAEVAAASRGDAAS